MRQARLWAAFVVVLTSVMVSAPARAAVEQVRVLERTPFASGVTFGAYGAYEKIRGVATFALDPDDAANAHIIDLKLAPRDAAARWCSPANSCCCVR